MATMRGNTSIAASASNDNVLDGEDYEFIQGPAIISVLLAQSAIGLEVDVKINTEDLVSAATPNVAVAANRLVEDGDRVIDKQVISGGRLKIPVRNTTAGALSLHWLVEVEPVPAGLLR